MKAVWMKGALVALSLLTTLLSACVPSPVVSPAEQTQIAATGMAGANRILANVQSSATPRVGTPAPTPLPLNPTPLGNSAVPSPGVPVTGATAPTPATLAAPTVFPSATSAIVPNSGATSVAPTGTAAALRCNQALTPGAGGQLATLWINNETDSSIDFTLNLTRANSLGQCGFMTFGAIKPGSSLRVTVPVNEIALGDACYSAWALLANTRPTIVSGSGFCIRTPQRWLMNVHNDRLRLVGP